MTPIPDRQAELQASIEDLRASREASRQRCIEIARRDEVLRWMVGRHLTSPSKARRIDALRWARVIIERTLMLYDLTHPLNPGRPGWLEALEVGMIDTVRQSLAADEAFTAERIRRENEVLDARFARLLQKKDEL